MSAMYGVVSDNRIIGIHEDIDICDNYAEEIRQNKNIICSVVKLKKKHKRNDKIYELYLLKYGDSYIQSKYYDTIEYEDNVILDEYKNAKNTLLSLLNFIDDDKEKKHINKTILILEKHISLNRGSFIDTDTMDKIIEMRNEFLNTIT